VQRPRDCADGYPSAPPDAIPNARPYVRPLAPHRIKPASAPFSFLSNSRERTPRPPAPSGRRPKQPRGKHEWQMKRRGEARARRALEGIPKHGPSAFSASFFLKSGPCSARKLSFAKTESPSANFPFRFCAPASRARAPNLPPGSRQNRGGISWAQS